MNVLTRRTKKPSEKSSEIVVHPWWHFATYLLMFAILALFTYMVLSSLTERVKHAEDRADYSAQAVVALSNQVTALGAQPVITPQQVAQGAPGTPGATGSTGAPGLSGAPGVAGPSGTQGIEGPIGPQGISGTAGKSGKTGAVGPTGADGQPGQTGQTGQPGQPGQPGADGKDGADGQPGPAGPAGPKGDKGDAGPAGPQCPDGYTQHEQTLITPQAPTGEQVAICVADDSTGTSQNRNTT